MDLTVPAPLRFLRHAQDKAFERDVERYRLYTAEGLSFRQIARLEQQHRGYDSIDEAAIAQVRRKRSSSPVRGESAVRMSVTRIAKVVQPQASAHARRRRLETPAVGVQPYACADHGQDCPETCPNLRRWWDAVKATLPTSTTGKLRRETTLVGDIDAHIDGEAVAWARPGVPSGRTRPGRIDHRTGSSRSR